MLGAADKLIRKTVAGIKKYTHKADKTMNIVPKAVTNRSTQLVLKRKSEESKLHHEDVLAQGSREGKYTLLTCY